jgi:hypothetical protein
VARALAAPTQAGRLHSHWHVPPASAARTLSAKKLNEFVCRVAF